MTEAEERNQFDAFMERNVARLTTHAQPYIGALVPSQREYFLKFALVKAWENRGELKAKKTAFAEENVDILHWWEEHCLKPAARSRSTWTLRTWDRQIETVKGRDLGRTFP